MARMCAVLVVIPDAARYDPGDRHVARVPLTVARVQRLDERSGAHMKATEANLLGFLKKSPQFVIPIYQRTYSWTEPECRQLWDDIIRTGRNDEIAAHFVGSIVYIEKGLYQVTSQAPLLVIDGQQRLTTVMLILE